MSGKVVIQVENLSKYYRLGSIGGATLREDLGRWWARVRGRPDPWARVDEAPSSAKGDGGFWALRDVSFEVREGEVLGVIGRNGAGKSTLLKILSRITSPTSGRALIRGRVGSLLEVGTGFHPELTGRENIYLNGAILGMTRAEITRKLDEIIEFAEMAKFIDTPAKRYSSGMTVRLAFAVAAHLEPEILIVDEVLAVGDAEFQRKCIGKMKDVAGHGRTVLFVSHNMQALSSLCSAGLMIRSGAAMPITSIEEAISNYLHVNDSAAEGEWVGEVAANGADLVLTRIRVSHLMEGMQIAGPIMSGRELAIDMTIRAGHAIRSLCIGFDLFSERGDTVLRSYDTDCGESLLAELRTTQDVTVRCVIPAGLLNAGVYRLAPRISVHNISWLIQCDHILEFEVMLNHGITPYWGSLDRNSRPGVVAPIFKWQIVAMTDHDAVGG